MIAGHRYKLMMKSYNKKNIKIHHMHKY